MSKSSRQTVLVTGATGTTGSALLRLLEESGFALRAMIRHKQDVAKLGDTSASIVIGDFDDAGSIAAALDGVDSAYLVTPSSIDAEAQQIRFAELAAAARVRHLVKLSQLGAKEDSPVRFLRYHAAVERRILNQLSFQTPGGTRLFSRLHSLRFLFRLDFVSVDDGRNQSWEALVDF